jgi:nuclear transcription factor Y gamma
VMKADPEVKMISAEAPILFAKGCDIFITELTMRAWIHAEENKRRTLQRSDIASALSKSDMFDFLIDIVPREEANPHSKRSAGQGNSSNAGVAGGQAPQHPQQQQQINQPDFALGPHGIPQDQDGAYRQPNMYNTNVPPPEAGSYPPPGQLYGGMENMYAYPQMPPQQVSY